MEWQALKTLIPLRAVRSGSALFAKVCLSYNLESLGKVNFIKAYIKSESQ